MKRPYMLSVVIPCYNEASTLEKCVDSVINIKNDALDVDIHVVDDASDDGSYVIAKNLQDKYGEVQVHRHERNFGKGAAPRTGIAFCSGDFVVVQDADLEYNPKDLLRLITPIINNKADVVLGSRFSNSEIHRALYFWHFIGNKLLTLFSNMMTDLNLSDMETCYKVFRRELIQNVEIEENRFGFEPEITAKVSHLKARIYEMGISYFGRTYDEGKKIGWRDGFRALFCIFKYNLNGAPFIIHLLLDICVALFAAFSCLLTIFVLRKLGTTFAIGLFTGVLFTAAIDSILRVWMLMRKKVTATTVIKYIMLVLELLVLSGLVTYISSEKIADHFSEWQTILLAVCIFQGTYFLLKWMKHFVKNIVLRRRVPMLSAILSLFR